MINYAQFWETPVEDGVAVGGSQGRTQAIAMRETVIRVRPGFHLNFEGDMDSFKLRSKNIE